LREVRRGLITAWTRSGTNLRAPIVKAFGLIVSFEFIGEEGAFMLDLYPIRTELIKA
jgi:hypothetical protein